MQLKSSKTVLVAPLDWGLGHATRCIPVITALLEQNYTVILAANGAQRHILLEAFPQLLAIDIPDYAVQYGTTKFKTIVKLLQQSSKIRKAIKREQQWLQGIVPLYGIDLVISDNRYGLYHQHIKTVFITHQLLPKSFFRGIGEKIVQRKLYRFIQKFSQCWIPDEAGPINLAGALSHPGKMPTTPTTYIGPLTRLKKIPAEERYYCCFLLSGPEPQRTILEKKILQQMVLVPKACILICGLPGEKKILETGISSLQVHNHLSAQELNEVIAQSRYIISRSGYTTVMDLLLLQKKCLFIPTPAQTEQEYLATYLQEREFCLGFSQKDFELISALNLAEKFSFKIFPNEEGKQLKQAIQKLIF